MQVDYRLAWNDADVKLSKQFHFSAIVHAIINFDVLAAFNQLWQWNLRDTDVDYF